MNWPAAFAFSPPIARWVLHHLPFIPLRTDWPQMSRITTLSEIAIEVPSFVPPEWCTEFEGAGRASCVVCHQQAEWITTAHMIHLCTTPLATELNDPDGNFQTHLCQGCLRDWEIELAVMFGQLGRILPLQCRCCQRPIAQVSDVILRSEHL